ncbi:MAG: CapA family protein [bacterium JZ-2024 1]
MMVLSPLRGWAWLLAPTTGFFVCLWLLEAAPAQNPALRGVPEKTVTMSAVGDIMIQNSLRTHARITGGYASLFRYVAPILRTSDITFGNLEAPMAPTSGKPQVAYSFNLDPVALDAIIDAGFTVVSIANNHLHDQGKAGIRETVDYLKKAGIQFVGVRWEPEDPSRIDLRVKGLRFSILAYTTLTNRQVRGYPMVALWDPVRSPSEIVDARKTADFVIVSVHWGEEYRVQPTPDQISIARHICESGADVVLGHHPHVLQSIIRDDAGDQRPCLVAFSLGNFVSNMSRHYHEKLPVASGDPRDSIILRLTLRRGMSPRASFVPLWMVNTYDFKSVVPMETLCWWSLSGASSRVPFTMSEALLRTRALRVSSVVNEGRHALGEPQSCLTALTGPLPDERLQLFPH